MTFYKNSLRSRLLLSTSLLLIVFLGLMGLGLNQAFKESVLSNANDNLMNEMLLLMGDVEVLDGKIVVPKQLSQARLTQTDSDLFAQISVPGQGVVWRSESLMGASLPDLQSRSGDFDFLEQSVFPKELGWAESPDVYLFVFGMQWDDEVTGASFPLTVQIAERTTHYVQRMAGYETQVMTWLLILGLTLVALLLALFSWVLRPLVRVTKQVSEIEQGERQRFDEDYPIEVSRLTQNLNQLLISEEQRIARQKETLGNLAHSLKTPIAIMSGLEYSDQNKPEAQTQLTNMQNIIDYQLQGASAVGKRRFAKPIDIEQETQQIIDSLNKLHRHKTLRVSLDIKDEVVFYGDKGDWMELVGNLLENAYKWAESAVTIDVTNQPLVSYRCAIKVVVSDDGVGISDEQKSNILQRGVRLDSQTPGHGLGLHIVKGIIDAYEGGLSIEDNAPKGSRFIAVLN